MINVNVAGKIAVEEPFGVRFVSPSEMVLFTYQADTRKWRVLLADKSEATMKRNFRAQQILALSPSFSKMNQGAIVNMEYVKSIGSKDNACTLGDPFGGIKLRFSRRSARAVK